MEVSYILHYSVLRVNLNQNNTMILVLAKAHHFLWGKMFMLQILNIMVKMLMSAIVVEITGPFSFRIKLRNGNIL